MVESERNQKTDGDMHYCSLKVFKVKRPPSDRRSGGPMGKPVGPPEWVLGAAGGLTDKRRTFLFTGQGAAILKCRNLNCSNPFAVTRVSRAMCKGTTLLKARETLTWAGSTCVHSSATI